MSRIADFLVELVFAIIRKLRRDPPPEMRSKPKGKPRQGLGTGYGDRK